MRITLVLGSGGARGYAHIGVIQELEARGHQIVAISGASMGALVGGVYAAGRLGGLLEEVSNKDVRHILRYVDPALGRPGMIGAGRIMDMLEGVVGDVLIEDLPIPYLAVATDLANRREVWFKRGPLLTAIRASIAIPTVFTPIMHHGRLLCDGGVLNPLPIEPAALYPSDGIVAVSLFGKEAGFGVTPVHDDDDDDRGPVWTARLREGTETLLERTRVRGLIERLGGLISDPDDDGSAPENASRPAREKLPRGLDTMDMLTMTLDSMQAAIEANRTANTPPDVLISIPTTAGSVFDFHRAEEIIAEGRGLAAQAFDQVGL
ncbi:MAG: patatin-like phospholipase family protein [bacterium]|nr:patatin-like phospholipase family protein [bacterium]